VFAAIVPEAATPGRPMPGKHVSPQASKDLMGVVHPGKSHCQKECDDNVRIQVFVFLLRIIVNVV
jgi:hypothetical protein